MKNLTSTKNLLVKVLALLLLFNISLLGENIKTEVNKVSIGETSMLERSRTFPVETVEVSLDSFSNMGILIMIALSSLLGAFFVKDEFSTMLE